MISTSRCLALVTFLALFAPTMLYAAPIVKVRVGAAESRQHAYFVLPSGLRVLVVSDPATKFAAGALTVDAGLGSDPNAFPGLAHLLEHVLFVKNKKYRDAYSVRTFFGSHGGYINAVTGEIHTQFFWQVRQDEMEAALDRFAQMFVAPLFPEDGIARELKAVDAEFDARFKRNDMGAEIGVNRFLIENPKGRSRQFPGNMASLGGDTRALQTALSSFFKTHYAPGHMTLVVVGREPVDQLERMIVDDFSHIPHRSWQPPHNVDISNVSDARRYVKIHGTQGGRTLTFVFPVSSWRANYTEKPREYVNRLLEYPGRHGLEGELEAAGWITGEVVTDYYANPDQNLALVRFDLTPEGLAHAREIGDKLFEFLSLMRTAGNRVAYFNEQQRGAALKFRYHQLSNPLEYARSTANLMMYFPPDDVIRAAFAWDHYDPAIIDKAMSQFAPDKVIVSSVAPEIPGDHTLEDYNAKYSAGPIPRAWLDEWRALQARPTDRFSLPPLSPYDPGSPVLLAFGPVPGVTEVADHRGLPVWYKPDSSFKVPVVRLDVRLVVPVSDARDLACLYIYGGALGPIVRRLDYLGSVYGDRVRVKVVQDGLRVTISGYSGGFGKFAKAVMAQVVNADVTKQAFAMQGARLRRSYADFLEQPPREALSSELVGLMTVPMATRQRLSEALGSLDDAGFDKWRSRFRTSVTGRALLVGNIPAGDARALAGELEGLMPAHARHPGHPAETVRFIGQYRRVMPLRLTAGDAAVLLYIQAPDAGIRSRAYMQLAGLMVGGVMAQEFRNERQLGYVIVAHPLELHHVPGLVVMLQSPRATAESLARMEQSSLEKAGHVLEAMPDSIFDRAKRYLVANLRRPPTSLNELGARLASGWIDEPEHPDSHERVIDTISGVTRQQMVDWYHSLMHSMDGHSLVLYSRGTLGGPMLKGRHVTERGFAKSPAVFK